MQALIIKISNNPLSILITVQNYGDLAQFLKFFTISQAYYSAVQLSRKITTFIPLICNDVIHNSTGLK